ncbi:SDR family NAD(P)-dependent oxidoreductase [Roseovarius sp. S4756]|uniref:SDR family NAD(P)-dependent oxidoreductase n=1 Tax=Roseovarius maritimus TaxID=3342637 RepID=UPI00372978CB
MPGVNRFIHRGRRVLAKSILLGRRAVQEMRTPTQSETVMMQLPKVDSATLDLPGKVVVITGGTQGVGRMVAERFGALGARLVINGRRAEAVETACEALRKKGIEVAGVVADAADADGAQALIDGAAKAFGGFDILINNAAIAGPYAPIWEIDADQMAKTLEVNLTGPILCSLAAIRWLVANSRTGRVINVSSIASEGRFPGMVPYSTSKAGIEGFTRHLASDFENAEVVVTALMLHSVQTERKFEASWAQTELLPPAEVLLPAFEFAATGPVGQLHGRVLSTSRFLDDAKAEAQLASVAAPRRAILYPEIEIDGKAVARDPRHLVLLDRAENQFGTSLKVIEAITASLSDHPPNFYPDDRFSTLRSTLARELDLEPQCIALGPGSWELISRMVGIFARPGEEIVSSGPGWFGFNLTCQRHGVAQKLVPMDRGLTGNRPNHNLGEMRDAIRPHTRMVYLISPSNPEGVTLNHREVVEFLADIPPELPVLIDEAYAEYSADPEMLDVPALVRESKNAVIGLRTFSKFYAMAGMRVGYAFARPDLIDLVRRSEQIFNLSHVAEMAAVAALEDRDHRAIVFEAARDARQNLSQDLTANGIGHIPSEAPFIFADAPKKFEKMVEELARDGVIVAPYRFNGDASVMLPVGRPDQNARILDVLRRHF